jgi:transcriptional regulator with PAS, ATPase and Fis domain
MNERKTESLLTERPRGSAVVGLREMATEVLFELDATRSKWVIGSGASCDVALVDDPFVSYAHCVLERRSTGSMVVRDTRSRNGTYVDGHPVEVAELRAGAYLSIGRTTLIACAGKGGGEQARAVELLRGSDPVLRRTVEQAQRAAQTDCNILIVGETGTGKDLLARVIHECSKRAGGELVALNCGAIPRELIASELFGHERGAFTGASEGRDGYFVQAHGGTLFLDEVGELPIELQPNLLRALEQKRVRRVGSHIERPVDVRIVAATNRTEGLGTESGRLRIDLYHRLATVVLALPPLRERRGDVRLLVETMLEELEPEFGPKRVADDAWSALVDYGWPGNVRELRHAVARAVALGGSELGTRDFFPDFGSARRRGPDGTPSPPPLPIDGTIVPFEDLLRGTMEQALSSHGSIRAAANAIGMPKSTFADRAKVFGLVPRPRIRFRRPKR